MSINGGNLGFPPIDQQVVLAQPCVSKDDVVMSEIADIEGSDLNMLSCFHSEKDLVHDVAIDIFGVSSILNDERSVKLLFLYIILLNKFPMDKAGVGPTVNESVLHNATLPLA